MSTEPAGNFGSCGLTKADHNVLQSEIAHPLAQALQILGYDVFCDYAALGSDDRREPYDVVTATRAASRARLWIGSCAMKPTASSARFDSAISGKRSPSCSGSASLPRPKAITPTSASAGDRARLWWPIVLGIVLGEPLGRGVMAHVAPLSLDGGHHPVTAHQPMPSLATASPSSSTASISRSRTTVLTIASSGNYMVGHDGFHAQPASC
jgi:hypothetical protein